MKRLIFATISLLIGLGLNSTWAGDFYEKDGVAIKISDSLV